MNDWYQELKRILQSSEWEDNEYIARMGEAPEEKEHSFIQQIFSALTFQQIFSEHSPWKGAGIFPVVGHE